MAVLFAEHKRQQACCYMYNCMIFIYFHKQVNCALHSGILLKFRNNKELIHGSKILAEKL